MKGTGRLTVKNASTILRGTSSCYVKIPNGAVLSGKGTVTASSTYRWGRISVELSPLAGLLSDKEFGMINADLPALTGLLKNEYVPPPNQPMFMTLPPMSFSGLMTRIKGGDINVTLPALLMKGGDFKYGEIKANLPALRTIMYEDPDPLVGECFSFAYCADWNGSALEHIVVINEQGLIVDSITATRLAVESVIEQMSADIAFTVIGEFVVSMLTGASIGDTMFAAGEFSTLDDSGRVWVVNMENGASSQYDNYGFNSFFERDGEYFGVAEDGIYKLDGDNDAGVDIDALLEIGSSNYGTHKQKKSHGVYVGCSSTGNLYLKVNTDGTERIYQMTSHSAAIQTHKIPVSHRQIGAQWNLTLMNENGCDFDVSDIDFRIFPMTHRSK